MENKKSFAITDFIFIFVIGLVAVFVISAMTSRLLGKGGAEASDFLSSARDDDGDGIANLYDKCDCLHGDEKNEGCPINEDKTGPKAIEREEKCPKKIKDKR